VHSNPDGIAIFVVPEKIKSFVVNRSSASKEYLEHLSCGNEENDKQWPYQIKYR